MWNSVLVLAAGGWRLAAGARASHRVVAHATLVSDRPRCRLRPQGAMLKPGHRVGQYEIATVLGDGGMAIVYKARHVGMGTDHAIKVLLPNLAMNPKTVERFRQEARAQFRLRHPNIVQVTDYVETDDAIALVMDLVQGMTLRAAMDQRPGPWPVADVVAVMRPVLDAVAYAHREGLDGAAVVHRDLKPENILLDLEHGRVWPGIPKVADFGIAKVMGTVNVATRTNARLGTVPYMSPEQFRSAKDVDARADVWALGMMLWHLAAGRLPLDPDDNVQLLQLYQGLVKIPALTEVVGGTPPGLSSVVAQALSVEVAGRFADARPLLRAVEASVSSTSMDVDVCEGYAVGQIDSLPAHHVPDAPHPATRGVPNAGPNRRVVKTPDPSWLAVGTVTLALGIIGGAWAAIRQAPVSRSPIEVHSARPQRERAASESQPAPAIPSPATRAQQKPILPAPGPVVDRASNASEVAAPPVEPSVPNMQSPYHIEAEAGTVRDSRTQLTWQRTTDGKAYNLQQAKSYCRNLQLAGGGWRLPTREDLEQLVEKNKRPTIDGIAFPGTPSQWFWTSTPWVSSGSAWGVNFLVGGSGYGGGMSNTNRVRCVYSATPGFFAKDEVEVSHRAETERGATRAMRQKRPPRAEHGPSQDRSAVDD